MIRLNPKGFGFDLRGISGTTFYLSTLLQNHLSCMQITMSCVELRNFPAARMRDVEYFDVSQRKMFVTKEKGEFPIPCTITCVWRFER